MPDNALYMIHNPHAVLIDAYDAVGLSKLENELHAVKKDNYERLSEKMRRRDVC